ncbi:hypothetical protein Golomagni_03819 [Golovinomyces magnicellulatus]|nr:hypothetical protein Golomagni_03819 [Golovinomyces magnicellulatus]
MSAESGIAYGVNPMTKSKSEDATLLLPIIEEIEFKPWTIKEATEANSTDVANNIKTRIDIYTDDNIYGRELHALWSSDFKNFSITEYKKTTPQTKALRDFLRS